jgi:hypothetical protein
VSSQRGGPIQEEPEDSKEERWPRGLLEFVGSLPPQMAYCIDERKTLMLAWHKEQHALPQVFKIFLYCREAQSESPAEDRLQGQDFGQVHQDR